jgi:hypothetical protein
LREIALLKKPNFAVKQNVDGTETTERPGVSLIVAATGAAILYGCLAFVISPLFALAWFATGVAPISEPGVLLLISSPLWFAALGAVCGTLTAHVYNVLISAMGKPVLAKVREEKEHPAAVGF